LTQEKFKVGRGLDPSELHIRMFCESGFTYSVGVRIEWLESQDHLRKGEYIFSEIIDVKMPKMIEWTDVVSRSKTLRIFFKDQFYIDSLLSEIKNIKGDICCTILTVASSHTDDVKETSIDNRPHVVRLLEEESLIDLQELTKSDYVPNFIIADESMILIETAHLKQRSLKILRLLRIS
jgi:hypothetical protein